MTTQLITVPFYGNNLFLVNHNNEPYTPMKPIVEGMGLDWKSQFTKLKQRFASTVVEITIVANDGKERLMTCLPLRKLFGWLNSISPNKVKPEIRDTVIKYQNECDDVLYHYWTKGVAINPRPTQLNLPTMSDKRTRIPLKDAVTLLVAKSRNMNYSEAYGLIHQRFNVDSVEDLTNEQLPQVVEYVHKVIGEFISKDSLPAPVAALDLSGLNKLQGEVDYWQVRNALSALHAILGQYQPYSHIRPAIAVLEAAEQMLRRLWTMIDESSMRIGLLKAVAKTGKPLNEANMDTLAHTQALLSGNMMKLQMPN